jgi:TPR repeat protein
MLKLINNLLSLNLSLSKKIRAVTSFDEALALHANGEFKQALPLMIEAAELGRPEAMSLLGTMYLFGNGVAENGREAVFWLSKSIELGYEESISVLGMAFATGKAGVKIDLDKAIEMLTFGAQRGDDQSARMLLMIEKGEGMFKKLKQKKRMGQRSNS